MPLAASLRPCCKCPNAAVWSRFGLIRYPRGVQEDWHGGSRRAKK
jgi:hypothetical protein